MKALLLFFALLLLSPAFNLIAQNDNQTQNKSSANSTIQSNIESVLEGDPILSSADVEVAVDDHNITLTGTVESYAQHQRVLQLVEPYTRYRKIVDKITTSESGKLRASLLWPKAVPGGASHVIRISCGDISFAA